ncbi:glycosyltransferase family 4 protein [Alloalcanivorax sp. C16-1]|uniref:glycosyltransferase family 4 protein n=1 Tax=Alloalcanivorax sp. C16-1 TaxID=3390051 RepID=UPI0039707F13
MKILDSTLFYTQSSGGVRTYIDAKRQALLRRGDMSHKVVLPGAGVRFDQDFVQLPAMPLPLAPGYRFPLRLGLWANVMAGLQPDLIEAGDPYTPAWAAQRAARMLDVPAVGFYHSDLLSLIHHRVGAFLDAGTRAYIRRLYQGFDLVLSPSQLMARRLAECGLEDVQVQPLGVDLKAFHPERARPDARQRLGIEEDRPLLVFAGRGTQEKNIPVLLEAMRALPDYHLLLIGTGLQPDAPDNVSVIHEFCPAPEVAGWMAAADALVHAGDQETFGLVALEGMACGLPVVCADAGALPEVVPARCGRHAPANDGAGFAEAIRDLFEHDDPAALGRIARAHVESRHSWDTVVDSLLGHYRRVLGVYDQPVLARTHESHS